MHYNDHTHTHIYSPHKFYTVSQFAELLKISRPTVMKMIGDGLIIATRLSDIPGSHYRIRETEIEKLFSHRLSTRNDPNHHPSLRRSIHIWNGIFQRCYNPKCKAYKYYGARGITICDKWLILENFLKDMGTAPKGWSIDRLNNDLGYSRENCVWSTAKGQATNKRNVILYVCGDKKVTLPEYARINGLNYQTLLRKRSKGIPIE